MSGLMTPERRDAIDILTNHTDTLTWRSAQFLGQVAGLPDMVLTEKQADWFGKIVERAGLPPIGGGA